ncbi:trypsin delta-like [Arctopsyche grandis]|uniref:trypsin delta-like n=1 Tax=Arctopsyche grandis TaxID=121162 RepID=UPI00406D62F1
MSSGNRNTCLKDIDLGSVSGGIYYLKPIQTDKILLGRSPWLEPMDFADTPPTYVAALIMQLDRENFICHVNLIDEYWAVTTSHCIDYMKMQTTRNLMPRWFIKGGITKWNEKGVLRPVRLTIKHPQYNNRTFANNVGLIKTTLKFRLSDGANYLQLPQSDPTATFNDTAGDIFAHGWSKLTYNVDFPELDAKHSEVRIVTNEDCKKKWNKIHDVSSQDICVGVLIEECVPGDASPLIQKDWLLGINSWGEKCEFKDYPQVYNNIYHFKSWILSKIKENS